MRDDNILTLKSGKKIGYAEYGNPDGIPILVHHGNPGSRLFWGLLPGSPFNENYRLIAPDRPGYGLSDFYGKESIMKWPGIIEELMSHLNIDKFYNLGVSGGGPYAIACTSAMSERIIKTSLISPVGPFVKESIGDMNINRKLFSLAGKLPWLIGFQFKLTTRMVQKNPDSFVNIFKKKVRGHDRELIENKDIQKLLKVDFIEAYRHGEYGSLNDCFIPAEWPIKLEEINGTVDIWYGDKDRSIGDMGKYLGEKIPSSVTHIIPGVGHFLVFEKAEEILKSLTSGEN